MTVAIAAHYGLGDANDVSGNGLHFTSGTASFAAGKYGNAASFNGTTNRLYRTAIPTLAYGVPSTLAFWLLLDATWETTTCQIAINATSSANRYSVAYSGTTKKLQFMVYTTSVKTKCSSTANFPVGAWKHVMIDYDGNATSRMFIDNVLQIGTENPGSDSAYFSIGARAGGGLPAKCLIDDLRVYDAILSDDERAAVFSDELERDYPWIPFLPAWANGCNNLIGV